MVKFITNRTFLGVFFSVLVTVFAVAVFTYATTIGSNVSVTGTLTSTGAATMSSTLAVTGATTLTGAATLSSTLAVTGLSTLTGFISTASSTVNGALNVQTSVAVASSTPSQELGIVGSALFQETSGTTTIGVSSTGSGVGSCIQLRATDGSMIRIYATTTPTQTSSSLNGLRFEAGSCL